MGSKGKEKGGWMKGLLKKGALVLAFAAAAIGMGGCSTQSYQDNAQQAVENLGFTDVKVEYSASTTILKCGQDDNFGWNFTGKNVQGKQVSGYVCNGFTKGSTVRF